jgi:competence ComEA-like helix-hairpin-helix protein
MAVDHSRRLVQSGGELVQSVGFVISICFCAVLCAVFLGDFSSGSLAGGIELDSRINPNDAPISSLVRLPGIGAAKAAAMVAYRDGYRPAQGEGRAFSDCDDLQNVKGIGPKTAENVCEWLKFD